MSVWLRQTSVWWWGATACLALSVGAETLGDWNLTVPMTLALAFSGMAVYENLRWRRPLNSLRQQLADARAGESAKDASICCQAEFSELGDEIRSICVELGQRKQELAQIELEIRDRVAGRTNALERQLSSYRIRASRDALTGLHNRRALEETLPAMIEKCRAADQRLSVLAIDVDRFKVLNDTLGHAAGDQFLKNVGQILASGVRDGDLAIRTGGDEFVVLLPGCAIGPAKALGNRLATMVDGLGRTLGMNHPPGLSVGAASISDESPPMTDGQLLALADRDLYAIKATRRRAA